VKFIDLIDVNKVKGGREISFMWEIDGVNDGKLYNMWCKRYSDRNEYDVRIDVFEKGVRVVFDDRIYRDMVKYKKKIDDWWIGEERGIDVFEKVDDKIKEESRFSIWDNGFWEVLYWDYKNKVIEI